MASSSKRRSFAMMAVAVAVGVGCASVQPLDPANDLDGGRPVDADADAGPDVIPPIPVATRYPSDRSTSPVTTFVAEVLLGVRASNMALDDQVFMKAGDSATVSSMFLDCLADEPGSAFTIDLDGRNHLEETLLHFRGGDADGTGPFERDSLAAQVGRTARWAISGTPSPLDQELDAVAPRFSVVSFGTNDMQQAATHASALEPFYENLNALLDQLLMAGNVPIITGLPPRTDAEAAMQWAPTYNAVTRGVAESFQLPYIDLYFATVNLPDQGLGADGLSGNVYRDGTSSQPCVFSPEGLQFHYNLRNLLTSEVLDTVRRVVLAGEEAPDDAVAPVEGDGSPDSPFIIDSLPFTHTADTTISTNSNIDDYPDCDSDHDESGSEYTYRLELPEPTPIRFTVLDRGDTDIDVHLLDANTGACIERDNSIVDTALAAGTYHVVVDTFVPAGEAPRAGSYQFVAIECEAADPECL